MSTTEAPAYNPAYTVTFEDLRVNELEIDTRVQREALSEAKVRKFVADFRPGSLGLITVSRRSNGQQVILDGGHRTETVRRVTDNTGTIAARVLRGLTLEEEAAMFLDLNPGSQPTIYDRYRVSIIKGDPEIVAIDQLVHAYGFKVSNQAGLGNINAIKALQKIYNLNPYADESEPNILLLTLLVVSRSWSQDRHGLQGPVLEGVAYVLAEHAGKLEESRLIEHLKEYPGGPTDLLLKAKSFAVARRGQVSHAVAELIVEQYNRGLSAGSRNALPPWRKRRG